MHAHLCYPSLGKVFRISIDHYNKLCLFLKNRLEEIIENKMSLWTGVSSYSKNRGFFP